jgi:hypothetical protein
MEALAGTAAGQWYSGVRQFYLRLERLAVQRLWQHLQEQLPGGAAQVCLQEGEVHVLCYAEQCLFRNQPSLPVTRSMWIGYTKQKEL